jgi:hypothetical protein
MTRTVVIASALGLAALVGLGAYEFTAQKNNEAFVPPSPQPALNAPLNAPMNTPLNAPLNSSNSALPPGSAGISSTPTSAPGYPINPSGVTETTTTTQTQSALPPGSSANLMPLTPQAAPTPESTYTEKTTTETYVRPTHTAYARHTIKYHKKDKIHVARAVKHTAEFAVKMPGRLTF